VPVTRVATLAVILVLLSVAIGCGGDGGREPAPTPTTSATGSTGTGSGPQGGSAVESLEDVQAAVIQIVADGTFRDPELGLANGSGAGSGFLINDDGLAVTNNHVVAGATTLEVYVGGDTSRAYNATIVGVSECNDLAVIDINESQPLPYLEWYDGDIVPGIDVYAAGFPLGDPQVTLTPGIVSKARANGDIMGTSSIDHAVEHDARLEPGSSGGPLVATDGRVVGVNYGGRQANSTGAAQFFAISSELARPVVERLKDGDFESLGINGWAVMDEEASISGVWVAAVAAGSPASRVGLVPGDIIRAMNGAPVGTDGTMAGYCDVIRTAGTDRPISIEVLRYDTREILRGEINGDKRLTTVFSPAEDLAGALTGRQLGAPASHSAYITLADATNSIEVDVPADWDDVDSDPFDLDGEQVPHIAAAPNLNDFFDDTYKTSGMEFAVFQPQKDLKATVDRFGPGGGKCADLGYFDYSDAFYTGVYHAWESCGDSGTIYVVLAAVPVGVPAEESYTAVLLVQLTADADFEALDTLFTSFEVNLTP
jgi:serine protease Do